MRPILVIVGSYKLHVRLLKRFCMVKNRVKQGCFLLTGSPDITERKLSTD